MRSFSVLSHLFSVCNPPLFCAANHSRSCALVTCGEGATEVQMAEGMGSAHWMTAEPPTTKTTVAMARPPIIRSLFDLQCDINHVAKCLV